MVEEERVRRVVSLRVALLACPWWVGVARATRSFVNHQQLLFHSPRWARSADAARALLLWVCMDIDNAPALRYIQRPQGIP